MSKKRRYLPLIYKPEYIVVNRNANQSILTNVWTKVLFDTTLIASGIVYDTVNNQIVLPNTAFYSIDFVPRFASSSTAATHGARVLLNGIIHHTFIFSQVFNSNSDGTIPLHKHYYYNAGDVLTFECIQGSGLAKNLSVVNDLRTYASVIRMSNDSVA